MYAVGFRWHMAHIGCCLVAYGMCSHVFARLLGGDLASLDFGANPTGLPRRRAPEHVDLEILRGFGIADLGKRGNTRPVKIRSNVHNLLPLLRREVHPILRFLGVLVVTRVGSCWIIPGSRTLLSFPSLQSSIACDDCPA